MLVLQSDDSTSTRATAVLEELVELAELLDALASMSLHGEVVRGYQLRLDQLRAELQATIVELPEFC